MTSWFDKSVKLILPYWEKTRELDNTKSKEILKIEYYDVKESILAMAESLISSGQVILKR